MFVFLLLINILSQVFKKSRARLEQNEVGISVAILIFFWDNDSKEKLK